MRASNAPCPSAATWADVCFTSCKLQRLSLHLLPRSRVTTLASTSCWRMTQEAGGHCLVCSLRNAPATKHLRLFCFPALACHTGIRCTLNAQPAGACTPVPNNEWHMHPRRPTRAAACTALPVLHCMLLQRQQTRSACHLPLAAGITAREGEEEVQEEEQGAPRHAVHAAQASASTCARTQACTHAECPTHAWTRYPRCAGEAQKGQEEQGAHQRHAVRRLRCGCP